MSYALESQDEYLRLEKQALQPQYCIPYELRFLNLKDHQHIVDVGCGSGAVTRALLLKNPTVTVTSVDMSEVRLKQAEKLTTALDRKRVSFCKGTADTLPLKDGTADAIVCRFVFEYLADPLKATQEFKRVLKPGGVCYLIDLDGIHYNTWTNNSELNAFLAELPPKFGIDLCAGRKLRTHLVAAGFKAPQVQIDVAHFFTQEDITLEKENNEQRFVFARPSFIEAFGCEQRADRFIQLYLKEMDQPGTNIFFNKFITWALK